MSAAHYKRVQRQTERDERNRAKIAREALKKDLEVLIRALNSFLTGETTNGPITPMKMHLQVHAVALAAISERAVGRLKRSARPRITP